MFILAVAVLWSRELASTWMKNITVGLMSKGRNDTDMYSTSLGDITVGLNSASRTDDTGVHSYVQFMLL